jgi:hypothetical protein
VDDPVAVIASMRLGSGSKLPYVDRCAGLPRGMGGLLKTSWLSAGESVASRLGIARAHGLYREFYGRWSSGSCANLSTPW